jgi:hypothetical protein
MIESYTTERFYCVCDKCGAESDDMYDKEEAIIEAEVQGWEIQQDGKCLCFVCAVNERNKAEVKDA